MRLGLRWQSPSQTSLIIWRRPELQIKEDLRRFRMLMEAGEIATTEGQPQGSWVTALSWGLRGAGGRGDKENNH